MFTLEQIKAAHGKVKSGADFPAYISEIKKMGVSRYETFVSDGHTDYYGNNKGKTSTTAKYDPLTIAATADAAAFLVDLKGHQQGKTDYLSFCGDCARSGIEKWVVQMDKMTCTYYDSTGIEVLTEEIPH
jgi:uncharacterized protein YbcV (DUF1398 family)